MKTRRRFLTQTAAALAATAILPDALPAPTPIRRTIRFRGRAVPLEELSFDQFERLVDTAFVVGASDGVRTVLLVQAERHPAPLGSAGVALDNFSLLFRHGTGEPLAQSTYLFYHSRLGEFGMFIVPVARPNGGQHYEAIFNRLVE